MKAVSILALVSLITHSHAELTERPPASAFGIQVEPTCPRCNARELMDAIKAGDTFTVRSLLEKGVDPNSTNYKSSPTPLMTASYLGHLAIVDILLDAGAEINAAKKPRDLTTLFFSVMGGRTEVARTLLARGADPDIPSERTEVPLHYASRSGKTEIVRLLLNWGADPNGGASNTYITPPLINAIFGAGLGVTPNLLELVSLLINAGADPNLWGSPMHHCYGSALGWAKEKENSEELVAILLRAGAVDEGEVQCSPPPIPNS